MAPAKQGAVHQDAERATHAAAAFRDRVEDRAMPLLHLVASREGRDARSGQRGADGCRRRGGARHDGQFFGEHGRRDLERVQDPGERLIAADPHRELHQPLCRVGLEELGEHVGLDTIVLDQLSDVVDDARLRGRQPGGRPPITNRVDRGHGHAGLPGERHVRVPDVAAVSLASRRADGELGVLRLDDAVAVEELADLVPGPGESGAVQHDGRWAADAAAERGELVEERVVLDGHVVPIDDQLHARHVPSL